MKIKGTRKLAPGRGAHVIADEIKAATKLVLDGTDGHVSADHKPAGVRMGGQRQHQIVTSDPALIERFRVEGRAVALEVVTAYLQGVRGILNLRISTPVVVDVTEEFKSTDGFIDRRKVGERLEVTVSYESDWCPRCEAEVPIDQEHGCYEVVVKDPTHEAGVRKALARP